METKSDSNKTTWLKHDKTNQRNICREKNYWSVSLREHCPACCCSKELLIQLIKICTILILKMAGKCSQRSSFRNHPMSETCFLITQLTKLEPTTGLLMKPKTGPLQPYEQKREACRDLTGSHLQQTQNTLKQANRSSSFCSCSMHQRADKPECSMPAQNFPASVYSRSFTPTGQSSSNPPQQPPSVLLLPESPDASTGREALGFSLWRRSHKLHFHFLLSSRYPGNSQSGWVERLFSTEFLHYRVHPPTSKKRAGRKH